LPSHTHRLGGVVTIAVVPAFVAVQAGRAPGVATVRLTVWTSAWYGVGVSGARCEQPAPTIPTDRPANTTATTNACCIICAPQASHEGQRDLANRDGKADADEPRGCAPLLDPTRTGVTLDSRQRAASALGLTFNISFEPPTSRSAARPHGLGGRRKKRAT